MPELGGGVQDQQSPLNLSPQIIKYSMNASSLAYLNICFLGWAVT